MKNTDIRFFGISNKSDRKKDSDAQKNDVKTATDSMIPYYSSRAFKKVYRIAKCGVIGKYLSSYDKSSENIEKSYIVRKSKRIYDSVTGKHRRSPRKVELPFETESADDVVTIYKEETIPRRLIDIISNQWNTSRIIRFLTKKKKSLLETRMSSYGIMLLAFSLVMFVINGIALILERSEYYIPLFVDLTVHDEVVLINYCVISLLMLLISLPMILNDQPFIAILYKSRITGRFMSSVMGIRDLGNTDIKDPPKKNLSGFAVGFTLGIITLFVSPLKMLLAVLVIIAASVTLTLPEVGIVVSVFAVPFISVFKSHDFIYTVICGFILFSLLIKIISASRVMNFSPIDIAVTAFLVVVIICGIWSVGAGESYRTAWRVFALTSMYFAISSLMKSWQWIKKILLALTSSGLIIASLAIAEKCITTFIDNEFSIPFVNENGFSSVFDSPTNLAVFMVICIFAMIGYITANNFTFNRFGGFIVLTVDIVCLILTNSKAAILVTVLAILMYVVIKSSKSILPLLLIIAVVVTLFVIGAVIWDMLPDNTTNNILSFLGLTGVDMEKRYTVWKTVTPIIFDNFTGGIGVGNAAFGKAVLYYSPANADTVHNSNSLFLQLLLETGIGGLIVFITAMLLFIRASFTLMKKYGTGDSACKITLAFLCGIIALICFGTVEYIWSDSSVYLSFWIFLGISQAIYGRQIIEIRDESRNDYKYDVDLPVKSRKKYFKKRSKCVKDNDLVCDECDEIQNVSTNVKEGESDGK